jgi:hypothetical protein
LISPTRIGRPWAASDKGAAPVTTAAAAGAAAAARKSLFFIFVSLVGCVDQLIF